MIKGFQEWINESDSDNEIKYAIITLEFDWTLADQMTKPEALQALMDEFERVGMPDGVQLDGRPVLDGWSSKRGSYFKKDSPNYYQSYTAEFEVSYTCSDAELEEWADSLQLGEITDIDFD